MPIMKRITEGSYSTIPNKLAQNEKLTYEAKGLLIELLSRPENWTIHKKQLYREHTGEAKLTRIFTELQKAGYLYIHTLRSKENGEFIDRIWFVANYPNTKEEFENQAALASSPNTLLPYLGSNLPQANPVLHNKDKVQDKDNGKKKDNIETQKPSSNNTKKPPDNKKEVITKKGWARDSIEYEISRLLLNLILKRTPDYFGAKVVFKGVGYEEKIQSMCIDFDRLLRLDKRDPEETIDVILWCQKDPFWSQNINSSYKFREQYSRLRDGMSVPGTAKEDVVVDKHPKLTAKIKRLYAQRIIGDIAINCSDADNEKFIKAGAKANQFVEKWNVNLITIPGHLINCLINNFVDHGKPVHPGNLCSDNTWNILLPQHLKEIGIQCKKGAA